MLLGNQADQMRCLRLVNIPVQWLIFTSFTRHLCQNKSSLNSCAASCKGNTETHCVQTTVFLILTAGLAGPAGRFARKSLAANAGRGRLAASLQEGLPPLLKGGGAKRRRD